MITHRTIFRSTITAAALWIGFGGSLSAQNVGIAVGSTAPTAAVETLDGKPVDLGSFIGKTPVVLHFWATWCPLCKEMEPAMKAAQQKYAGRVTFVAVGVARNQTPEKEKAYIGAEHLLGEFVFDAHGTAAAAYKVPSTSYTVVIDKGGKVAYTGVGGTQNIDSAIAKAIARR